MMMRFRITWCVAWCVACCLLATQSLAQDQPAKLDHIEFFGSAGVDTEKAKAALPVQEGQEFASPDALFAKKEAIEQSAAKVLGHPVTDVAGVCCDESGGWIIFLGLGGADYKPLPTRAAPTGSAQLAPEAAKLYQQFDDALQKAIEAGHSAEDESKGYALSEDAALKAIQLKMRDYALAHCDALFAALAQAKAASDREAAAHLAGYCEQSPAQIKALADAMLDPEEGVRNNAVRALAVLVNAHSKFTSDIPTAPLIAMLHSGKWTDLNKASFLLAALAPTASNDLKKELCDQAVEPLIEIASWHTGHADAGVTILSAITGLAEDDIRAAIGADELNVIRKAAARQAHPSNSDSGMVPKK